MPTVRRAKPDDVYEFVSLSKQFIKEADYPFSIDNELLVENFGQGITNPNFIVLIAEDDGEAVGFLAGCINTPLFSRDRTAVELGFFMRKDKRDGRTAMTMLANYEKWAKSQGCRHITMVDIDPFNDLADLYERKGYRLTEKSYIKEV